MADFVLTAAKALVKSMDKAADDNLPYEIAQIVKDHSKGAAVAAVAAGWIPGAGAVAAVAVSAGFIWTMYGRINHELEVPFSENVMKSLASGVATNLAAGVVGGLVMSAALSMLPGLGSVGASAVAGATCYALTIASGYVYLKVLTNVFRAGTDPTTMSADDLKRAAKDVAAKEDMKSVVRDAKSAYKDDPDG